MYVRTYVRTHVRTYARMCARAYVCVNADVRARARTGARNDARRRGGGGSSFFQPWHSFLASSFFQPWQLFFPTLADRLADRLISSEIRPLRIGQHLRRRHLRLGQHIEAWPQMLWKRGRPLVENSLRKPIRPEPFGETYNAVHKCLLQHIAVGMKHPRDRVVILEDILWPWHAAPEQTTEQHCGIHATEHICREKWRYELLERETALYLGFRPSAVD